jgi:hypothetical protein
MNYTGKGIEGPGSDLLLVDLGGGAGGVAIAYRGGDRPELAAGLDAARGFLRSPGVDGLLALVAEPDPGVFVYDRKGGLSVRELLLAHARLGRPCGERAGLELLLQSAEVLADAAGRAAAAGLPGHGDISPWRLLVDGDGYADLLGYGLPPLALLDFLEERADTVPADALRYAPPERLELRAEDALSDVFSLTLVAVELIAGRPVFDGAAEDVIEALLAGEAPARIERLCPNLPDPTLDLLCISCDLDPTRRYPDIEEVIRVVKRCLRDAEGPSLKDVLDAAKGVDVLEARGPGGRAAEAAPAAKKAAAAEPEPSKPPPPPAPTDPLGPPAPLPALAAGASLEQVRARARAVVARVEDLHRRTTECVRVAKEEAAGAPPEIAGVVRRMQDAVAKAEKAAASAKRSAGLVDLDEDAGEALVTLGLVTAAEQQGQAACEAAREWLDEVRAGMIEVKRSRERVDGFAKKAQTSAGAAAKALGEAEDLVTELERGLSSGELSAPGVEPAAEVARKAILRARSAGSKANDAVAHARGATSVVDAEAYASSAEAAHQVVQKALAEIAGSVEKARKGEQSGLESARADVVAQSAAAAESAATARKALERARAAVDQGPDEEAKNLVKRAAPLVEKATHAADLAKAGADRATSSHHSAVAREALVPARRAAHEAADAADQVQALCKRAIALAGAAAQAAEALATAREAAQKVVTKAQAAVQSAIVHVESLLHDTDEVHGAGAVAERERASRGLADARDRLAKLLARHERFATLDDPEDADAEVRRVKADAASVHEAAEQAEVACKRCRELAEEEIRDILAERRRLQSLEKYATAARGHADQCRTAVDAAWKRYKGLPEPILRSDIREVRGLLKQAYEVIDIAEFQAGEARTAADAAARQGDPGEAAGYAESAASFWARISEDLPEALKAISEAETLATAELKALDEARTRTARAATSAVEHREAIRAAARSAAELSEGWTRLKVVAGALEKARKADTGLDDAVAEAEYARDRAASCDKATDAAEMIPLGEAVASRLEGLRATAEGALADLKKAVQVARSEKDEVEKIRAEIGQLSNDVLGVLKKVKSSQERLDKVLAEHGATGTEATSWQEALEECMKKVRIGRKRTKEALETLKADSPVKEARALADRCRKAHETAMAQAGPAAEAEAEGVKAAEREARARAEADERRKTEAREAAKADAGRAEAALAAVQAALADMEAPVQSAGSREATSLYEDVRGSLGRLRDLAASATRAREAAAAAPTSDAVLSSSLDAREAAQRATSTSREALAKLGEARTLALAAAEQAAALQDLRDQMSELAQQADGAVKLAKEQSGFLDEVLDRARTDATRALRGEADEALASVRKAATKVHTAVPMLAEAESLDVAMHMLKAARRAVDAANEAAAQVPRLVAEAERRLVVEAEDARKALEAAREAARAPLAQAEAAVDKARALSDAAQPALADYADEESVTTAFADLSAAVATVEALQRTAEASAEPVAGASTAEEADAIGAKVRAAVDRVIAGGADAKAAREAFDAAVARIVEARARLQAAKDDAQAGIEALRGRIAAARTAYATLEKDADGAPLDPVEVSDVLDRVEETLGDANDAVLRAGQAVAPVLEAPDLAALEAALEGSNARRELAVARLDAFDKALADARDELERMKREVEERRRADAAAAREREAAERDDRARTERDALRAARPGLRPGLRPAGPPRGDTDRSGDAPAAPPRPGVAGPPSRSLRPGADATGGRLRPPGGARPGAEPAPEPSEPTERVPRRSIADAPPSAADRRLRRPGEGPDVSSSADRRLRRPGERSGDNPADRRLRRPGESRDDADTPADRRLRRSSASVDSGASPVDRRLRRPGESREEAESPADRRLRRPGEAPDAAPPDRTLRRPGERPELRPPLRGSRDESAPPADDPAASGDRDDLRSRLRERRASRMAGAGGAEEVPVRPTPGGPTGRPPLRGPGAITRSSEVEDAEGGEESGADLLRRRLADRGAGRVPPTPTEEAPRPRRSIKDLRSRMRIKPSDDD